MSQEVTKIIEQYLNNELPESDRKAFEERLNRNEKLRKEVELQKTIHEAAKRGASRAIVKQAGKSYHFTKNLITSAIVIVVAAAIAVSTYVIVKSAGENNFSETAEYSKLLDKLDKEAAMENIPIEYFSLGKKDTVVLSANGVLLSVPETAFLLNGKPYSGTKVIQWQEAMDAAAIVKGGLSTMSGDKLLETQGMFGIKAFTTKGKQLDVNPKVGVYVQVPVDELKEGMQLFEGKPGKNGVIDWQNPQPLEKKPVMANMRDLDFYPPGYEKELNKLKWKTDKKSRDSLYLSFEEDMQSVIIIGGEDYVIESDSLPANISGKNLFDSKCMTCHHIHTDGTGPKLFGVRKKWPRIDGDPKLLYQWVKNWKIAANNSEFAHEVMKMKPTDMGLFPELSDKEINAIFDYVDGVPQASENSNHIPPSSVFAFWKPQFNKTLLSTRDFEKRMASIHGTCNKEVLKLYTGNLQKPLYEIDEAVAKMGYPEFSKFAEERVGAVKMEDPHMKNLQEFYDRTISQLREKVKTDKDFIRKLEEEQDNKISQSRNAANNRRVIRESQNYGEEFDLNYDDCLRQLGKTRQPVVGFTITGGAAVYNLDKFVAEMTANRTTGSFYDKETGKTAKIQYNSFSVSVDKPEQYEKLFMYLFPHELNSFQRIDPKSKGMFDYPLNNIIQYDLAVIGINENGYYLHTQKGLNKGDLGKVKLEKVSERKFNERIEALNKGRNSSPVKITDELSWLADEKANYKVQRLRKEMEVFREGLRGIIYPCVEVTNTNGPAQGIGPK